MSGGSLPRDYFESLYAKDADPWRFKTSPYERDKYADTLAGLEGRRFRRAIEVGCSIGVLTAALAEVCDDLLGVDIADAPLAQARILNAGRANVRFARMALPDERPQGRFDLIVLSEVLYYLDADDLGRMAAWTDAALEPDGVALMVHWLGETPDYPLTGDEACDAFIAQAAPGLSKGRHWRRENYRLDQLIRPGAGSRASDARG